MKRVLLQLLQLALLCAGCKVKKESAEKLRKVEASQTNLETTISWRDFNTKDSTHRYWHFVADSSFYFHPEMGLSGHAGVLTYGEYRNSAVGETTVKLAYDSLANTQSSLASEKSNRWNSAVQRYWLWLLLIPLAAVAYWGYKRGFR